ncbi:uncharacterized protein LOC134534376 [Bacillus rossius redtenbacheri]|uniref:uncharacterized protein LOC134534376 n=1 Tax=Bacillus rossius redtenbacheri TaxID=93214 RepID=UPI002FDCE3DA
MTDSVSALERAENRLQRAADLAKRVTTDTSKQSLFFATCRDLSQLRNGFEDDHLAYELACKEQVDFDDTRHTSRLNHFDDLYYEVNAIWDTLVQDSKNRNKETRNQCATGSSPRLPAIDLPHFQGNPTDWLSFSNLFEALVVDNRSLTNVERLSYLKSSLSGDALAVIQALPLTDSNYSIAWELLSKRYSNKRLIVSLHIEAIMQIPSVSLEAPASVNKMMSLLAEHIAALRVLDVNVEKCDPLLLHIIEAKLDKVLRNQWELFINDKGAELPKLTEFLLFLEGYRRAAESQLVTSGKTFKSKSSIYSKPASRYVQHQSFAGNTVSKSVKCFICSGPHEIYQCPKFLESSPKERYQMVRSGNLCLNCLRTSHHASACLSSSHCRSCDSRHHTLLHFSDMRPQSPDHDSVNALCASSPGQYLAASELHNQDSPSTILLSTALIEIPVSSGRTHTVRALLDSASQSSFMTEGCVKRLGLIRRKAALPVYGVSQVPVHVARGVIDCLVKPVGQEGPRLSLTAFILPKITGTLPTTQLNPHAWDHLSHLQLADPHYAQPGPIDVLIGADLFPYVLSGRTLSLSTQVPVAIDTVFGWVVMGRVPTSAVSLNCVSLHSITPTLDDTVRQFWEVEEVIVPPKPSSEDIRCEQIFLETCRRDENGRYSVALPFKEPSPNFEESRVQALKRFHYLERKMNKNPHFKASYVEFMSDYVDQGHMSMVQEPQLTTPSFYIPHHGVLKPDSSTTKLRVVFDASAKDSKGTSLNDQLLTGPKLQRDIADVLLSFRDHAVAFTADIRQMYRQILVQEEFRDSTNSVATV